MKKSILFLFLFSSFFCFAQNVGISEHVPVTQQDLEAMQPAPVNADSLAMAGDEIDALVNELAQRIQNDRPNKLLDWGVLLLAFIGSLVGALKKWMPFFKRQWQNIKGDTPVLIFSGVAAIVLTVVNNDYSAEAVFTQFAITFTTAVTSYKLILRAVWDWLAGIFTKKEEPAA